MKKVGEVTKKWNSINNTLYKKSILRYSGIKLTIQKQNENHHRNHKMTRQSFGHQNINAAVDKSMIPEIANLNTILKDLSSKMLLKIVHSMFIISLQDRKAPNDMEARCYNK